MREIINYSLCFFFSFLLLPYNINAGDEPVDIGGNITILKSNTSCQLKNWENSQINSCQCCLAKNRLKKMSDASSLKECTTKKYCSDAVFNELQTKIDGTVSASENLAQFIAEVTNDALVAKRIEVPNTIKGALTDKTVPDLINAAFDAGLIDKKVDPKCLKVIESKGGWYSAQLFIILHKRGSCVAANQDYKALYVLKGLKSPQKEIYNLHVVKNSKLVADMKSDPEKFPNITLHEFALSYKVGKKRFYFILLQAAAGQSFMDMIKDSAKLFNDAGGDPSHPKYIESFQTIREAYKSLGEKMGNLHQKYMDKPARGKFFGKTIIHGDFHYENVFYDKNSGEVSLIDNESFANTIAGDKADPGNDIVRIYFFSAAIMDKSLRFAKELNDEWLAFNTLKPFLEGYVNSYPKAQKASLKAELKKILVDKNALQILIKYSAGKPQVYSPLKVESLQSKYVGKIIEGL